MQTCCRGATIELGGNLQTMQSSLRDEHPVNHRLPWVKTHDYPQASLRDEDTALRKLNDIFWLDDCHPSSERNRWYKRRHDIYQKPSLLRHRRQASIYRKKRGTPCSYDRLDGWDYGP